MHWKSRPAVVVSSLLMGLVVGLIFAQNPVPSTSQIIVPSKHGLVDTTRWLAESNPPVGSVIAFAGKWDDKKETQTGWMLCKGQKLSSAEYSELASALGVSGATFELPNLCGRCVIGSGEGSEGNTQFTKRSVNEHGGAEAHYLTIDEMPEHTHGITDPGHQHDGLPTHEGVVGALGDKRSITSWHLGKQKTDSKMTGITINKTGGSKAHNNMPPFWVLNYIIKVRSTLSK